MEDLLEPLLESLLTDLIVLIVLMMRKKNAGRLLQSASQLQQETGSRLNDILVSDTFRDLELGLAEGETKRRLQHMRHSAFQLQQQSDRFSQKLKEVRPALFSIHRSQDQIHALDYDIRDWADRVDRYVRGLGQHGGCHEGYAAESPQAGGSVQTTMGETHIITDR